MEQNSVSSAVRQFLSKEKMQDLCSGKSSVCRDFLWLLTLTGGPESEEILLFFLSWNESNIHTQAVADIISDLQKPSPSFLETLGKIVKDRSLDPDITGKLGSSIAHLGSKANKTQKIFISEILTDFLKESNISCHTDSFILDVLEAVGNLKDDDIVPTVLMACDQCLDSEAFQIACGHALRHSINLPEVQEWTGNRLKEGNCNILGDIVVLLMEKIQDQEMTLDTTTWPRRDFNEVDNLLRAHLMNSHCSSEGTLLYFKMKRNAEANEIALNFFGTETELRNPWSNSRQKRSWDHSNCQDWTYEDRYKPIQTKEEFEADTATFNERASCLAHRKIGVDKVNADIIAGLFAGIKVPSDPLQIKILTKVMAKMNLFGKDVGEIGSFHFSHESGKTKAYIRVLGRTRENYDFADCSKYDISYQYAEHFPLFLISIGVAQLSFGIDVTGALGLRLKCPEGLSVFQVEPYAEARVGADARGNVLFLRVGITIGGNLNYKLQLGFRPLPNMCVQGGHGYDPMTISIEPYFQIWELWALSWGGQIRWKPAALRWTLVDGNITPWFDDICLMNNTSQLSFLGNREIEEFVAVVE